MISHIKGIISEIDEEKSRVVVDVGGVGYEILLPMFVMRSLVDRNSRSGDDITLKTYYHVTERQPRPMLVGFNNEFEKKFFEKLIEVEDLGPAKAAKAFVYSVSTVANAIEDGDVRMLQSMPGVGGRTAQKIIATLKEKVAEFALLKDEGYDSVPPKVVKKDIQDEAIEVLAGLGYKKPEAKSKVDQVLEANSSINEVEAVIREVFRAEKK
ncbi:MAG: Holliday junction branch migration protein RuvA [Dehalococcoidia bacterium]